MIWLSGITQQESTEVLDLACGGGIITNELLSSASKVDRIVAGDVDEQMLSIVTSKRDFELKINDTSNWSRVQVEKMNQASIPHPDNSFTHTFNNFGIFFCPDDKVALAETYRTLKPSGVAGFTSWKSIAWWAEVADPALAQYLPEAPKLPSPGGLFPTSGWSDPNAISAKLENAGFSNVRVSEYKFSPRVEAEPFAQATGFLVQSIARRAWSAEGFERFGSQIEAVLLRYLRENYQNGIWDGFMTAIIALGEKQ